MILCIIALLVIFIPKYFTHKPKATNLEDVRELDSLANLFEKVGVSHEKNMLFRFNPNSLSVDSLELLGFARKIAERVDNYRKKGGTFYRKEELKKNLWAVR